MRLAHVGILALSVSAGVCWAFERSAAAHLRTSIEALRHGDGDLARLRREHARLLLLQSSLGNRSLPAPGAAAAITRDGDPESAADAVDAGGACSLQIGAWAAADEWRNCGRATPEAAVETMLSAAARGDLDSLKDTLEFDGGAVARAKAILADLPDSARRQYASPEDLLALIVGGNVPLDSARLVASQRDGPDEVTEYVRLKNADGATRQVYMSLRRGSAGWRLSVPESFIDLSRIP